MKRGNLFACCCLLLDPYGTLRSQWLIFCGTRLVGMSNFLVSLPTKVTPSLGSYVKLLPRTRR